MAESHQFDPTVLREYDIRGIMGQTLSAADATALGRAFATEIASAGEEKRARVCVGFDGRLSSPELEAALVDGLTRGGVDAVRVGLGPTPMLYFAVKSLDASGGIMVTGSHNPPDHNGFKLMLADRPFYGEDIKRIGRIAAAGAYSSGEGGVESVDIAESYVARLLRDYRGGRDLKVAWDAGNGAAGGIMAVLAARLPGRHVVLNERIDGTFPVHHPDPTVPENLEQLQAAVLKEKCDLGIAFDGDGDRIGVVDDTGAILWGDQLMVFLAAEVLADKPGAMIIADVKASQVLFDEIARMGGRPLMWRTGHSLIKAKMAETGAPLAGEMSGHIFFADRYYGFDDALYAAVRLLGIVSRMKEPLSAARARLPKVVNTPEIRFPCAEQRKFAVVDEVAARLKASGADVQAVDGVRVRSKDGWWLLRASNTQAVLVARCESATASGLERLKRDLLAQVRESGLTPPPI
ncbi:MAG: phosphomannomutase/phosphoglucomutase [Alphaproteobacteria bacterium]